MVEVAVNRFTVLCVALLAAGPVFADTITLRDGTQYTGVLVSANRSRIVFNTDNGGRRNFNVAAVQSVRFGNEEAPLGSADRDRSVYPRDRGVFPDDSRGRVSREYDNDIERKAAELGRSFVGAAVSPEITIEDGRGRVRVYDDATIYWTPENGAHEVHGVIRDEYLRLGGFRSRLGYPTADERAGADGRTRVAEFEKGTITHSPELGVRVTYR